MIGLRQMFFITIHIIKCVAIRVTHANNHN